MNAEGIRRMEWSLKKGHVPNGTRLISKVLGMSFVLMLTVSLGASGLQSVSLAQSGGGQQTQPQGDVTSLVAEGDQLVLQSRFEEAEAKYGEAIRLDPNNPLPYTRWSRLLVLDMKPDDAAAKAQMAIQIAPTNAEAYARLSRARDWQRRYDEALMAAQQAITLDPNYAEGYAVLSEVYLDMGQVAQADAQASKALQLDPNNAEAHRSKAFVLAAQNNMEGAIKEAERAAQTEPMLWVRFDDLATMLYLIEDYNQAITFYQRAIDIRPKAPSYTGMGLGHIALDQLPQALTALQAAVNLNSGYAQGQAALGLVYARMGQCSQALPHIQQALQLEPGLALAKQAQDLCGGGAAAPLVPLPGTPAPPPVQIDTPLPGPTPIIIVVTATPGQQVQPPAPVVTVIPIQQPSPPPPPPTAQPILTGKIAYPVFDAGRQEYDIYLANADGSNRQRIIGEASSPDLSPDGNQIAYRSWEGSTRGVWARRLDGTEQRILTQHAFLEDTSPKWAPAADLVTFASRRESDRRPRVYLSSGSKYDWVVKTGAEAAYGEAPNWLPDGRIIYNGCIGNNCGLIVMNNDGGVPQQITTTPSDTNPDVSPNGSQIAFMSQRDGNWEIYTSDLQGSNLKRLTSDPANDGLPVWSPDGLSIAFASDRGGVWAI